MYIITKPGINGIVKVIDIIGLIYFLFNKNSDVFIVKTLNDRCSII